MEQKLIWVDLYDHEIGCGEKLETHQNNILHRAFSVFLYSNGKMLIQQREENKYHSGGLWANSCCSHPRQGEETLAAAGRRIKEELGIPEGTCNLKEIDSFVYFQHQILAVGLKLWDSHLVVGPFIYSMRLFSCCMWDPVS